jgi:hypothetical protein
MVRVEWCQPATGPLGPLVYGAGRPLSKWWLGGLDYLNPQEQPVSVVEWVSG